MFVLAAIALTACGPQIGNLEKGEQGRVERVYNGDTLELDSGLRVFLAEIDAPRNDQAYAREAQQELESVALHRPVQLAYGGAHRWTPRQRNTDTTEATATTRQPRETAIAHVFVQSEGGRWIWLQRQLVSRGSAFVRTRRDNRARATELLQAEAQARAARRGLWAKRDYAALAPRTASAAAVESNAGCRSGEARYAIVEGRVSNALVQERRAALDLEGGENFSVVVFGDGFSFWDGPTFASYQGANIRVRGTLGMFHDQPQLCIDHAQQIEIVAPAQR